jgi:DNA-directed RNA polymerase specialized sigma24 family protein
MTNMSRGRGTPWYGKLMTESLPSEVKHIWYSRDEELEPLPAWRWSFDYVTDLEQVEQRELLEKILEAADLSERYSLVLQRLVLEDCTLEDVGQELGLSRERVRQMEQRVLRRLRQVQQRFTNVSRYDLIRAEVTTWRRWSWIERNRP